MSEFIPSYSFTEFRRLRPEQIKRLKSCEITFNSEYLCTIVVPQTSYIRKHVEYLCQAGNIVPNEDSGQRSETLEEITGGVLASI